MLVMKEKVFVSTKYLKKHLKSLFSKANGSLRFCSSSLIVEGLVLHAEVWRQTLKGAVGRVHDAGSAVAAQSHGVRDRRVNAGQTVGELERLVVEVPVRTHILVLHRSDLHQGVLGIHQSL